jgi:hypothetical protein
MLESAIGISGNSQFTLAAKMCQALWKKRNWEIFKAGSSYPAVSDVSPTGGQKTHKISESGVSRGNAQSWQKEATLREVSGAERSRGVSKQKPASGGLRLEAAELQLAVLEL